MNANIRASAPGASPVQPRPQPPAGEPASAEWAEFSVRFRFPVAFTRGVFDAENPLLAETLSPEPAGRAPRCLFVVDEGVWRAVPGLGEAIAAYAARHVGSMALAAAPVVVPGGERLKSDPALLERLRAAILEAGIDRHSFVVGVGGGALLDAVGFAAATAHRGVRHVRVPTTTLSQNDSGVGVKNAVNYRGLKNYAGTFAPPWAVLNDLDFLTALPARERRAGLAEAVKVALIRDGAFYAWLEARAPDLAAFAPDAEEAMIRRCAALHLRQITKGGDPFELGSARPLDFGHWAAHKLESLTDYAVLHGEAVAIGIALDTRYSTLAGLLPEGCDVRVAELLERLGFRLFHPALRATDGAGASRILAGLGEFREHLGGELTITLLEALGRGVEVHEMDADLIARSIDWLEARAGGAP